MSVVSSRLLPVVSSQLSVRATPFHQTKSLFLKILPITRTGSRAFRKFLCNPLIRKNKGKGGTLSVASCQWSVVRTADPSARTKVLGRDDNADDDATEVR